MSVSEHGYWYGCRDYGLFGVAPGERLTGLEVRLTAWNNHLVSVQVRGSLLFFGLLRGVPAVHVTKNLSQRIQYNALQPCPLALHLGAFMSPNQENSGSYCLKTPLPCVVP